MYQHSVTSHVYLRDSWCVSVQHADGPVKAADQWTPPSTGWHKVNMDGLVAEAYACRDGVRWALAAGVQNLILETDSQTLVSMWNSRQESCSYIDVVLQDIEEMSKCPHMFMRVLPKFILSCIMNYCISTLST